MWHWAGPEIVIHDCPAAMVWISMSHALHMNEPSMSHVWVMSHTQMSHATHINAAHGTIIRDCPAAMVCTSCHTNACMSHKWMSHAPHMKEPCKWVMSHEWMHVTQMNESCSVWMSNTNKCVMPHMNEQYKWIQVNRVWVMSHIYTNDWVMPHTWRSHTNESYLSHATHMNGSSPTYLRSMHELRLSHVTHINNLCPMYERVIQMSHVWVMSLIWMSYAPHMNEPYAWVMSQTSYHPNKWGMSHIWMRHALQINELCPTFEWAI